jgi:lysozyme family protein
MSDFSDAVGVVITTHEGGFQNRPDDPGNYDSTGKLVGTKYGVSAAAAPLGTDIANLTLSGAEDFYRTRYGKLAAIVRQRVLIKVLDLAVNMQGSENGPATRVLQIAINSLTEAYLVVDGEFGDKTIGATNAASENALLDAIVAAAVDHYHAIEAAKPAMKAWFANWDARAKWLPPANPIPAPADGEDGA